MPPDGEALSPDAVHGHDALDAVMVTIAEPPEAGAESEVGLIANEQLDPNCVTV
jgi:hypothetical protein